MSVLFARPSDQADQADLQFALVVEDDPIFALRLTNILKAVGFAVLSAATVEDSLQLIDIRDDFAIAFIDLNLRDRSGLELISELRVRLPALPIVLSAEYEDAVKHDMIEVSQSLPVLCKPYDANAVSFLLSAAGLVNASPLTWTSL